MTKEEAIKHLSEWMDEKMWRCFGTIDREAIGMAIEALQDKSSGEWERLIEYMSESDEGLITFDGYRCSVCGVKVFVDEFRFWDYCPNCGALMENKE